MQGKNLKAIPITGVFGQYIDEYKKSSFLPFKVDNNGKVQTENKHVLKQVIKIDLSETREKEPFNISFDSIAVGDISGSFFMYINLPEEDKKMTIKQPIEIQISADRFYISNDSLVAGYAEIWLFKGV